jgi:hypothetical protein
MRQVGNGDPGRRRWPAHGWWGGVLVAVFWVVNWSLPGLRTHWAFFPLWLGYCLLIDACVVFRKGHSLLSRSPARYVGLFVVSVPGWWLFELLNQRTQNWLYEGRQSFGDLEYALLASLSFSTVMPAVFGTAELVGTLRWPSRFRSAARFDLGAPVLLGLFGIGWAMLALLLIWPVYFFPFLWGSVYLIVEPVNVWLGNRSLLRSVASGDWCAVLALWGGCLICGFFWEMWNVYSYPKWVYQIPFVDVLHVFEMPLLGYVGYLPFALELFAIYHLVVGLWPGMQQDQYVQIAPAQGEATMPAPSRTA